MLNELEELEILVKELEVVPVELLTSDEEVVHLVVVLSL